MKSELQKLKDGELYDYTDPEVRAAHIRAVELCDEYNETKRTETEKRERILRELFGSLGEWAWTGSAKAALQDIRIGLPGMLAQVFAGYAVLRYLLRN